MEQALKQIYRDFNNNYGFDWEYFVFEFLYEISDWSGVRV